MISLKAFPSEVSDNFENTSDLLKLIAADEYAIVYQCSAPPNASNIGDITFNIHFDHAELHSQQSFNLNLTSIGRYNITGENEIFDENFEIEVHQNSILLSRFWDSRTVSRGYNALGRKVHGPDFLDPSKVFSRMVRQL